MNENIELKWYSSDFKPKDRQYCLVLIASELPTRSIWLTNYNVEYDSFQLTDELKNIDGAGWFESGEIIGWRPCGN